MVPNNDYNRYKFTFRNTTSFLKDKMTLDVSANYVKQNDRNMVNQGTYSNPLVTAYLFPRGDDWDDIKMYERYDTTRKIYTQYWPQDFSGLTGQNPYWIAYRNLRETDKTLLGRFVTLSLGGMQVQQLRTLHVLKLFEHSRHFLHVMTIERSEVADIHTLEDVLLMTQCRLQCIVQAQDALLAVFVEIAFGVQPLRC